MVPAAARTSFTPIDRAHLLPATSTVTALTQQQPYTASYLARLATFVLRTPRPQLQRMFDASPCDIASLDPNSPKPDALTTKLCQRLITILKFAPMRASPDTVPYALCLLLHFRLVPAVDRDCIVSRDISDETWICISVYLAYKFLTDWPMEKLGDWAVQLETNKKGLVRAEREFMGAIGYRLWIKDGEYAVVRGRLDELWERVFSKGEKAVPPPFVVKRLKNRAWGFENLASFVSVLRQDR